MFHRLWTDPRVMTNVGFPQGLRISREQIATSIRGQGESPFDKYLVAERRGSGEAIGECKMIWPDESGLAKTDVKLLPDYWGHHYGVEVKQGLLDYLFTNSPCVAVEATPNVANIASIKMQEAVGGVRVGEDVFPAPEAAGDYRTPVHHYIYHVTRDEWARRRGGAFTILSGAK
jgi:RimJ/RimL family protein N-acetyltransferase